MFDPFSAILIGIGIIAAGSAMSSDDSSKGEDKKKAMDSSVDPPSTTDGPKQFRVNEYGEVID